MRNNDNEFNTETQINNIKENTETQIESICRKIENTKGFPISITSDINTKINKSNKNIDSACKNIHLLKIVSIIGVTTIIIGLTIILISRML